MHHFKTKVTEGLMTVVDDKLLVFLRLL